MDDNVFKNQVLDALKVIRETVAHMDNKTTLLYGEIEKIKINIDQIKNNMK